MPRSGRLRLVYFGPKRSGCGHGRRRPLTGRASRGFHVLVVDPNQDVADALARLIRAGGYRPVVAHSAEEALAVLARIQLGAILVEICLPDPARGLRFLERVRALPGTRGRVSIAVITGNYFLDDRTTMAIQSCDALLRFKPLWAEDLQALVRGLLKPGSPWNRARRFRLVRR